MSRELLTQAREYARLAKAAGADNVRAEVHRSRNSSVEWIDGGLDRIRESTEMGLSAALFVDGRYASHSTSDLRPDAVRRFLEEAVAMTRLLARDAHRMLPDPARYVQPETRDLGLFDPVGLGSVSGAGRRHTAQALEETVRSAPGAELIVSVSASVRDGEYQHAMVNSNGMEGTATTTTFSISADANIRSGGDERQRGYDYAVSRSKARLPSVESIGAEALRRAHSGLGARTLPTGEHPFILENRCAGRIFGWVGRALSGRSIQQNQSFLADRLGEQIASPVLTVIDEPHMVGGLSSCHYDDEGMASRRMPVLENGVLRNFYIDTYYASRLGVTPTTGTQTNLRVSTGSRDLDGLLRRMGTGILVTDFVGGNSNALTGDFSAGIRGQWVENGVIVHPIIEMNLSGSLQALLMDLEEMGNDVFIYAGTLRPSMRFSKGLFSGV